MRRLGAWTCAACVGVAACGPSEPRFEQYPVEASPDSAVDFAGVLHLESEYCGPACQVHYIIAPETGDTVRVIRSALGAQFRRDSRLLVINPGERLKDWCGEDQDIVRPVRYFYLVTNVSVIPLDSVWVC